MVGPVQRQRRRGELVVGDGKVGSAFMQIDAVDPAVEVNFLAGRCGDAMRGQRTAIPEL